MNVMPLDSTSKGANEGCSRQTQPGISRFPKTHARADTIPSQCWERGLSLHHFSPIEVACLRAEIKGEQRISKDEHHKEDADPVGSQRETARDNNPRQTHRGYCSRRIHPSSLPRRGSAQRAPVNFEDEDGNSPHKTGNQWEIQFSNR